MTLADVLLVGTPGSLRTTGFLAAAARVGLEVRVHAWEDVLAGIPAPPAPWVKIDAPTLTPPFQRAMIELGGGDPGTGDPGLRGARAAQRGFERLVERVESEVRPARLFSPAVDIAVLGDKARTHAVLSARGCPVPVPVPFAAPAALLEGLGDRAMVKLRWGSAAAGIVSILRTNRGVRAFTTMTPEAGGWYSSRRVRRVSERSEILEILSWLFEEGAHAEVWHEKDRIEGRPYDLRVVTVAGEPTHVVGRASPGAHPFTNLHLGGARLSEAAVREQLGAERFERVLDACRCAAACFPACHVIGLDVMWTAEGPRVIEANAFGDLLNDALWRGMTTYEAQLRGLRGRRAVQSGGDPRSHQRR